MRRIAFAVCATVLATGLQGCGMSLFGSSQKPRPVAPAAESGDAKTAEAQKPARQSASMGLKRFDGNADGEVSKNELDTGLQADFKKEDKNGDQALDVTEARALNERLRQEENTSPVFDWNADGRLVFSEFATQWRTLFDRSDRNGDGIIDEEELKSSGRERKPRPLPPPTFSGRDGRPPGSQ